ncbi:hypothetical protein chiPu_0013569 [Chiloscyllium punctatum]|uniref:Uncharacterized protein n=1 Tax=Chiloscyllium punctatum TaxID=137246 RepID=A0A401SXF8_CHIPU|nr:hypothetical protein [Chiloscyllium punctatum]
MVVRTAKGNVALTGTPQCTVCHRTAAMLLYLLMGRIKEFCILDRFEREKKHKTSLGSISLHQLLEPRL